MMQGVFMSAILQLEESPGEQRALLGHDLTSRSLPSRARRAALVF